jgi:hypothetical protein
MAISVSDILNILELLCSSGLFMRTFLASKSKSFARTKLIKKDQDTKGSQSPKNISAKDLREICEKTGRYQEGIRITGICTSAGYFSDFLLAERAVWVTVVQHEGLLK